MRIYSHFRTSEYETFEFDAKNYTLATRNEFFLSIYEKIKICFEKWNASTIFLTNYTESEIWGIAGALEVVGGRTQTEVADVTGISQSLFFGIWNRFSRLKFRLNVNAKLYTSNNPH